MSIRHLRASLAASIAALAILTLPGVPAAQQDQATGEVAVSESPAPANAPEPEEKSERELQLYADFTRFADDWVNRLNNTHSQGRSKMQVVEEGGTFRARYRLIEKKSVVVRESPSRPGTFCGILRYQDTVYESQGNSRDESLSGEFTPVPGTARGVSEIFQYTKGSWR